MATLFYVINGGWLACNISTARGRSSLLWLALGMVVPLLASVYSHELALWLMTGALGASVCVPTGISDRRLFGAIFRALTRNYATVRASGR